MAITDIQGGTEVAEAPVRVKKTAQPKNQGYRDLVWWKFKRNRLAVLGGVVVLLFYFICVCVPGFFSPYNVDTQSKWILAPPQTPHLFDKGNFKGPFVYGYKETIDRATRKRTFSIDESITYPINLFVSGDQDNLFGVIPS